MAMMRRAWPWLRVGVGVAILAALVWRVGTGAFLAGLRVITPLSILAALGIGLVTTVVSAWRWCLVAHGLGLRLTLPAAVARYYRSLLLNSVLPAGVLGDVHRAVSHGRQSGDVGSGVRAVVLERAAGQAVLLATGAVVLAAQPSLVAMALPGYAPLVLAAIVLAGVAAVAARKPWRRAVVGALRFAPKTALLSAAGIAGNVTLFVVAARVAGVAAPLPKLIPLMVLALVVMSLPLNVGGWGPREGFTALAFGATGLGSAAGLTTAVVYGVLALVSAVPAVVTLFLRGTREKTASAPRAPLVPCSPKPAKAARRRQNRCTRPVPARGGAADRPRSSRPSRSRT